MKTAILAAGGFLALALLAGAPAASAGSLMGGGFDPSARVGAEASVQNVRWVRQCWRVPRGWGEWRHWETRCRSAWVPGHRYREGYGYGGGYYGHGQYDRGGAYGQGGYYSQGSYGRGGYDGQRDYERY